jgi:hypothetical protein
MHVCPDCYVKSMWQYITEVLVPAYTVCTYRCYERHILDVIFERYREADVAVEECEHQLQDLNMLSVRTQRPLKILFKPHDFNGGSYTGQSDATAAAAVTAASTTVSYFN